MSQALLVCTECQVPLIATADQWGGCHCPRCGRRYDEHGRPIASSPPPPTPAGAPAGETLGGLVPTRNPNALIAYYLGVFSLIPCIGLALAIPAVILGVRGLRCAREHPEVRGTTHAWVGIVAGTLFALLWGGLTVWFLIDAASGRV